MAISTAFKQQCPSCEAFVPVKDSSMVGKKIDCPKCKYRFVVEAPAEKETPADETKPEQAKSGTMTADKTKTAIQDKAKLKANGKAVKGAGKAEPAKANGQATKTKPAAPKPETDMPPDTSSADTETAAKTKPSITKNKKLMLGLGLAGVGVAILGVAAFVMMGNKKPTTNNTKPFVPPVGMNNTNNDVPVDPQIAKGGKGDKGKDKDVKPMPVKPVVPDEPQLGAAGPEFTNLLPNDSEHVLHVYFKNAFDQNSPIRDVVFPKKADRAPAVLLGFSAEELRQKLGLAVLAIDDLLRAENFTVPWTFTILHTTRAVHPEELVRALDLEPVQTPIQGQTYFVAKKPLPWLAELGQLGLGAPEHLRALRERRKDRPLYVHVHGESRQVVIFADEAPLAEFLRNGGRFKYRTELPAEPEPAPTRQKPGNATPPGLNLPPGLQPQSDVQAEVFQQQLPPGIPKSDSPKPPSGQPVPPTGSLPPGVKPPAGGNVPPANVPPANVPPANVPPAPPAGAKVPPAVKPVVPMPRIPQVAPAGDALGGNTYMTIKRTLKTILDSLEKGQPGDKVYFSTATNMDAARLKTNDPDFQDHLLWHYRQFWDVTHLLQERTTRIHYLGVTLQQKKKALYENHKPSFRFKNEIICTTAEQAKGLEQDLIQQGAPRVARFFDAVLGRQKIDLKTGVEPGPGQTGSGQAPGPAPGSMPGSGSTPGIRPSMPGGAYPPGFRPPGGGSMPSFPGGSGSGPGFPGGSMPSFPGGAGSTPGGSPPSGFSPPGMGGMRPGMPGFPGPGGQGMQPNTGKPDSATPPPEDNLTSSRITIRSNEKHVEFILDVILDPNGYSRLYRIARLFVHGLKGQVELAEGKISPHMLARAGKDLGMNGLTSRLVPAGSYPPGAFPRPEISGRDPSQRISWMAALLPYLGHGDLYGQINFDHSWRDPSNWLAGHMLVPEFIDPAYPLSARRVLNPDLPLELAATHYVGIAGVGLDAADYPANDPAFDFKRGILGYESSRPLKEVAEHGLSNTILLMQVPHDGPAGITPWIAGGGSTLRGVPEKNSIEPFVLTTDKDGKAITYKGKRGAPALMADGSVRWIDAKISDEVFKAMCTAKGPVPDKSSLTDWAPEIPPPVVKKKEKPPAAKQKEQKPTDKTAPAKAASAKTTPAKAAPAKAAPAKAAPAKSDPAKTAPGSKGPAQKQPTQENKQGKKTSAASRLGPAQYASAVSERSSWHAHRAWAGGRGRWACAAIMS